MQGKKTFTLLCVPLAFVALACFSMCSNSSTTPLPDTIDPGDGGQISLETPEVRFYPQDGRANVVTTTDIELYFSVDMDQDSNWLILVQEFEKKVDGEGKIAYELARETTYVKPSVGALPGGYSSEGVSWQRRSLTIDAPAFTDGSRVTVSAAGFVSAAGVAMDNRSATFDLVDYENPTLTITAGTGTGSIDPASPVKCEFSELVCADGEWTVHVYGVNADGVEIDIIYTRESPEVSWDGVPPGAAEYGRVLSITPDSYSGYYPSGAIITVDAAGFTTAYGEVAVTPGTGSFSVSDREYATIVFDPDGTSDISRNTVFNLKFNETVNQDCGWEVLVNGVPYKNGDAGVTWNSGMLSIDPAEQFTPESTVMVETAKAFMTTDGYPFEHYNVSYHVKKQPEMTCNLDQAERAISISEPLVFTFDEKVGNNDWSVFIDGQKYMYDSAEVSWNEPARTILTVHHPNFEPDTEIPVLAQDFKAVDGQTFITLDFKFIPTYVPVTGVHLMARDENGVYVNVKLDESLKIQKGKTRELLAEPEPYNATDQDITSWVSTNINVATVPDESHSFGMVVTAVEKGNAVITVTTHEGAYKASCRIKVVNSPIAFASNREGDYDIYVMNADGTDQTSLMNNTSAESNPSWSPDGTKIAFNTNRDGNYEIYAMNADGSNQTRLTNCPWHNSTEPRWSPDGTRIAFHSGCTSTDQVYVMNADGSGQVMLTASGENGSAAWLPDGSKIAFNTNRDGDWEIYVMNTDGSGQTRLTNSIGNDWNPTWSPDGSRIVFQSYRDENWEIYVMNANGSGQTRLTNNGSNDQKPFWSPDGTQIVFESDRDGHSEIYVMNSDGTHQDRITSGLSNNSAPSWLPTFNDPPETVYFIVAGEPITVIDPVPDGITFPVGVSDNGDINLDGFPDGSATATITYGFVVGETEVTYRMWKEVYDWATSTERGVDKYTFANAGQPGCGSATTDLHPVVGIDWRDAMVWCNALTEYCNKDNSTKVKCVYYTESGYNTPHRDSWKNGNFTASLDAGDGGMDNPYVNVSEGGFRLLTADEWELAARYIGDLNADEDIMDPGEYYHGNYASGADAQFDMTALIDYDGDAVIESSVNVAVYAAVFAKGTGTEAVRSRWPNAMGIYDMSGNVWEWCFDTSPNPLAVSVGGRMRRGGGWNHAKDNLPLGDRYQGWGEPYNGTGDVGFRIVRTKQ